MQLKSIIKCLLALSTCAITFANTHYAYAAKMDITAEFKPDPGAPYLNKFTNTTPNTGFCTTNAVSCKNRGTFSLRTPLTFTLSTPIEANHTDPRAGAMFTLPSEWRDLIVTNTKTLEQSTVRIKIDGFASEYTVPKAQTVIGDSTATAATVHTRLWGANWAFAPAPCSWIYGGGMTVNSFKYFWLINGPGNCSKNAKYNISDMTYNYLDLAYAIETPNPLKMSTGTYTGSITYSVGPHGDFDMGNVMIPNESELSLDFTLSVLHALKVDIPPGGDKVELTPKGGWQQWLQKGRIPEKLSRDQTFLLSSSSRFKMQLVCDLEYGETCAISNGSHEVPVDVLVSMPNGVANDDDSAVSRKPLSVSTELLFQSTFYVEQKPSTLHFEIQKQYVEDMLDKQGKYSGNITVVWDSEL